MATNAKDQVADDDKEVTEEDLRKLKESVEVETSQEEDETTDNETKSEDASEEDSKTDQSQEDESEAESDDEADEDTSEFVKQYPNIKGDTLDEYARGIEEAYQNSTSEALRLKKLLDEATSINSDTSVGEADDAAPITDPRLLYLDQILDKDIQDSFAEFKKSHPQVNDPLEYDKFQKKVASMSTYIMQSEQRVAPASELYSMVAAILGWKPETAVDSKERLAVAVKGTAAVSKTSSTTKPKVKSSITDAEVAIAKNMWAGGMSDADIRKQLELAK